MTPPMTRDRALSILRAHEAELRASGVIRLRLFGSVARDEATGTSDVDVLADFTPEAGLSLWSVGGLYQDLSDMLGMPVDVSREKWMKEHVRKNALREAVVAF